MQKQIDHFVEGEVVSFFFVFTECPPPCFEGKTNPVWESVTVSPNR